ncbi:MAG: hypothetical protein V4718_04450 [Pseudomonadota bacterium]
MEKVDFTFKNRHTRVMPKRQAELLSKLGHGTYATRDMAKQPNVVKPTFVAANPDGLDEMDREQLHALAKERGLTLHHMLGAEKARSALREAAQA